MDSQGYPPLWDSREYSFYFEQLFGNDYDAQQKYLRETLATRKIASSVGHRVLAALIRMGIARLLFTTNFDEVVETAYAAVAESNIPAFHLEGSHAALAALNADQFPIYVKLHGDFRYQSVKNLARDLLSNDQQLQRCFAAAATRFGVVVSGYSGRDENVMAMFREAIDQNNAFPQGLYWTTPRLADVAANVRELISYAHDRGINAKLVQTGTFDEMLSKIWRHTPQRPVELDQKVRSAIAKPVAIPLPAAGNAYPVVRTNALLITKYPEVCAAVTHVGDVDIHDIRTKLFEQQPDCTVAYTDRVLFWGSRTEVEKVVDQARIDGVEAFRLDDLVRSVDESGILKAFVEEAIIRALIADKPLLLRRADRTWYAVVDHRSERNGIFNPLRRAIGSSTNGQVTGLANVHWAEGISIRLEERNGSVWLLLRPEIWISPLKSREDATHLLRQKKSRRYNGQAYQLLSAWVGILLGSVGGGQSVIVVAHAGSEYPATFEISTRTAYSRRSAVDG